MEISGGKNMLPPTINLSFFFQPKKQTVKPAGSGPRQYHQALNFCPQLLALRRLERGEKTWNGMLSSAFWELFLDGCVKKSSRMIWSIRNFWRSEIVRDVWNYNWWTEIWWLSSWPRFTVSTSVFFVVMALVIIIISSASSSLTHSRHTQCIIRIDRHIRRVFPVLMLSGTPLTHGPTQCFYVYFFTFGIWLLKLDQDKRTHVSFWQGLWPSVWFDLGHITGESIYPLKWVEGIRNVRFSLQTPRNLQQDPLNGPLNLGI